MVRTIDGVHGEWCVEGDERGAGGMDGGEVAIIAWCVVCGCDRESCICRLLYGLLRS